MKELKHLLIVLGFTITTMIFISLWGACNNPDSIKIVSFNDDITTYTKTHEYPKLTDTVHFYYEDGHYNNSYQFLVYKIDSCEYIIYKPGSQVGFMSHKGNCTYCTNKHLKQIQNETSIINAHTTNEYNKLLSKLQSRFQRELHSIKE